MMGNIGNIIILLIIAILPVYLIGLYVYNKDKDKESRKLLVKLFLFGVLSCVPAVILELIAGSIFGSPEYLSGIILLLYVFLGVALPEEICKWFFVHRVTYDHEEFDHIYDAIVYCVFVSLGFAGFENILYVVTSGISTGLLRAITSIPGHTCFAIAMGNYYGLAKIARINGQTELEKKHLKLSVIVPMVIHGIYDYCLMNGSVILLIAFLGVIVGIYVYGIKKIKRLSNVKDNFIKKESTINKENVIKISKTEPEVTNTEESNPKKAAFCPNCGAAAGEGNFCTNCGNSLLLDK